MGNNNKENLKNSLGISEYPWSSDDEDTNHHHHSVSDDHDPRRPFDGSQVTSELPVMMRTEASPTSGNLFNYRVLPQPTSVGQSMSNRPQLTRDHKNFYWSLLNRHPDSNNDLSRYGDNNAPQPHSSRMVIYGRGSADCFKSDIQRIIAFKRLNRSLSHLRSNRPNATLYTLRNGHPSTSNVGSRSSQRDAGSSSSGWGGPNPDRPPADELEPPPPVDNTPPSTSGGASIVPPDIMSLDEIVEIDPDTDINQNIPSTSTPVPHQENAANGDSINLDGNISAEVTQKLSRGVKRKKEAHDDDAEPISAKDLNSGLLRILECPVCLEWMEPPMSQCRRGHLVCSRCRERIASCPVCRTSFSSVRNRAMETVAELLRYPCRHGCGREVRLRRRAPHEASCEARRYLCPAPACVDRPRSHTHTELTTHFQSEHQAMVRQGGQHTFSIKLSTTKQHEHWFVMALQEVFHVRVDVDVRTWGVVVYVAYMGPRCNSSQFVYEVTVTGQHNARKIVYTRATHSDLESYFLNLSRQDCFQMSFDQALKFLRIKNRSDQSPNQEKFLSFNLEVTKRERPEESNHESDT